MSPATPYSQLKKCLREFRAAVKEVKAYGKATSNCPRFVRLLPKNWPSWTAEECEHVSSCHHCQNMIAAWWRQTCPEQNEVVGYFKAGDNFCFRQAMEFHLYRDDCEKCNALLDQLMTSKVQ